MDKRTIIAFILIGILILFWNDYYTWLYPPAPQDSTGAADSTAAAVRRLEESEPTAQPSREDEAWQRLQEPSETETPEKPAEIWALPDTSEEARDWYEESIIVETDYYRAKLSSDGARLVEFTLLPSQRYLKKEIELVTDNGWKHLGIKFWTNSGPLETTDLKYRAVDVYKGASPTYRIPQGGTRDVVFEANLKEGKKIRVTYTFKGDGYSFLYNVKGIGTENSWVRDYAEAFWRSGIAYTEPDTAQDLQYSKAFIYYVGDELETLKIDPSKNKEEGPSTGAVNWGAVRSKYFIASILPETDRALGAWMESRVDSLYVGKYHPNRLGVGLLIPHANGSPTTAIRVYIGPLDDELMSQVDPSLKSTMNWSAGIPGIDTLIKPISKAVLWALKAVRSVIPNYGVCIIIFSILVKLLIWPLTRKSYQSMAAMQRLQPKIKEIKEKYKKDAQRSQKEIMNLYKQEKVNPMGGCLPMLLQMPLLIGLFIVFRSTIEFRRAPFMLWIKDLSLPDYILPLPFNLPLYGNHVALLPLVMGITSYFQSKSTMTDPNQKMMLYFMPIFLTLIFNQFPSGLTLYYTLFNVWTLVQQKYTPPAKPALDDGKGSAKGGRNPAKRTI